MGTFYSNCQVRSDSQEAVVAALTKILKEPAYVSPSVGGWVGVYPEGDADMADKLAKKLSAKLACGVFFWSVYDSDIFFYTLYESGKLRDKFDSNPDYFEPVTKAKKSSLSGNPEALMPYSVPSTTLSVIQEVLHPTSASKDAQTLLNSPPVSDDPYLFADHQASDLAEMLGMDSSLSSLGYEYVEAGEIGAYVLDDFSLVGASAAKTKPQQSEGKVLSASKPDFTTNHRDHHGMPALVSAARVCSTEFVQAWLNGGCDVNTVVETSPYRLEQKQETLNWKGNPDLVLTVDYLEYSVYENGITPLMAAAGASVLSVAIHPGEAQLETIRLLLNAGADVNARSETGRTALGEALAMTDPKQHKRLTSRRPSDEVLQQAANRSAQVVEMLRAAGATE